MAKICSIETCDGTLLARGWCRFHYNRWNRYGDPLVGGEKCPVDCICGRHSADHGKRKDKVLSSPCRNCAETRPVSPCHGPGMKDEKKFCNRACFTEHQQRRMADRRATGDTRKYDMTVGEYEKRLAAQGGLCAICARDITDSARRDHCHTTGEWRGLLCNTCNWGLGHFRDDPALLMKAAEYLVTGGVVAVAEAGMSLP